MSTAVLGAARRVMLLATLGWSLATAAPVLVPAMPATPALDRAAADAPARAAAIARGGLERLGSGADVAPPDLFLRAPLARRVALPLETPEGTLSYIAAIDVFATYYTPRDGGKAPGSRHYGLTATGARATHGVVAVDPRVIPLHTWLYVPGYGLAQALDVGGGIIGNHIDVAFDDGDGAWWGRRYLTVFILAR